MISILITIDVLEIPFDSTLWPVVSALGLVPFCVVTLVISFTSLLINRDGWSLLGVILAFVAVGVAILTTLLILVIKMANNPV